MKIHIHDEKEQAIEGCVSIKFQKLEELNSIIDNSCEYILANSIFEHFEIDNFSSILSLLIKKLRLNGVMILSGLDIKLFAKDIHNDIVDVANISKTLSNKQSVYTTLYMIEKLEEIGLKIMHSKIVNNNYEIFCIRGLSNV